MNNQSPPIYHPVAHLLNDGREPVIKTPTLDEELENMTCPNCHGNETSFCHADACPSHDECTYWFCENCNNQWGIE